MSNKKIPVSLVLGSGGARGLAHIGVIRALHDSGRYEIRAVSGSSIGALIGGLYAAGKLDIYEQWVRDLRATDVLGLLDFSFTNTGLFKGDRLMDKLGELVGEQDIEQLDIAFTAIASDIEHRREIWLDTGSLFDAIRASIAIPGFFTPVMRDGCTLVDGGFAESATHRARQENWRLTYGGCIAEWRRKPERQDRPTKTPERTPLRPNKAGCRVSKNAIGLASTGEDSDSAIDIMSKSLEAMQDRIGRYQMAAYRPDTLIEIPVSACDVLDFHRAEEMIDLGYKLASEAI